MQVSSPIPWVAFSLYCGLWYTEIFNFDVVQLTPFVAYDFSVISTKSLTFKARRDSRDDIVKLPHLTPEEIDPTKLSIVMQLANGRA